MLYLSSPSKNGFIGFFKVDIFFKLPNFVSAYCKNSTRSEKLFLFAENVYRNLKTGKSVRTVKLLSSITRVTKLIRGLKLSPLCS